MDRVEEIERLVEPALNGLGYDLVRTRLQGQKNPILQIMAERKDRRQMTVEDCAKISRDVSAILDVEDPIKGAYNLEVSSPGIDRPLVRRADFERFSGFEARVETRVPLGGQRRFKGTLAGILGEDVILRDDGTETKIPIAEIARAKLILTDELIAASVNNEDG